MYMLKLAGSILIIGTGILAGMSAADRVRQQYEEMRELQTLLYALRSEILYARACLGEAFLKIGRDAGEPYRGWMMEMSRKIERRQDRMLSVIWKTGVRDALKNSRIQKRDLLRLEELGTQLGDADLEAQIRSLDRYLEELKHSMEEIREGMKIKIRLCQCLGVMGGIFVTILLI